MLTQALVPLLIAASAGVLYYNAVSPSFSTWEEEWMDVAADSPANDNISWIYDGEINQFQFSKYGAKKTYCFYPNSTLKFQMEPLSSPQQPYSVQWLSQFDEFQYFVQFVSEYVIKFQDIFPPIQTVLWAWSDLRIKLSSELRSQLSMSYTSPISTPCQIFSSMNVLSMPIVQENIPESLQYIGDKIGQFVDGYCRGCRDGCPLDCEGSNDYCVVAKSPYDYPCITVHSPKEGIFLNDAQIPFVLEVKSYVDLTFIQNLFFGLFIYFSSEVLATYRVFHYLLGAAIGIVCSIALLLYQMYKQAQNTARLLPGGSFLQSASVLTTFAFPITGLMMLPTLYRVFQYAMGLLVQFWQSESVFGIPYLGKLYFFFFGLIGCIMVWWFQWWAPIELSLSTITSTQTNKDDYDDDDVLEDIRRMEFEDLDLPNSQKHLAWCLQLFGVMLLLQSTSSLGMSSIIVFFSLISSFLRALYAAFYFWYHCETPGMYSELITTEEFEAQSGSETEKALAQLAEYLLKNKSAVLKLKSRNVENVKAFRKGRNHMAEDMPETDGPVDRGYFFSSWRCAIHTGNDLARRLEEAEAQLREEAKLIDRLTRENVTKNEQLQSMEVALSNEIEKHAAIVAVMKDKEFTQKQETEHHIDVLNAKLCDYQVRMEACSTLDEANATLRSRVDELVQQLALENKNHVEEIHAMRLDMFNHKMALEQTFRKSLQELDAQYLKKAYNAMAEESKNALVANAKLKDELQMQSIGVENLMLRFKAQAGQFHKMKVENEILEKGSSLRLKEIANLKSTQMMVDKKMGDLRQELTEQAQKDREELHKTIEDLKQENRQLKGQVDQIQKRCAKWKSRYKELQHEKAKTISQKNPVQEQEIPTVHRNSGIILDGVASFDPREIWRASYSTLPTSDIVPTNRCVSAPTGVSRYDVMMPLKSVASTPHLRTLTKLKPTHSQKNL
ncbi:hypothetical protein THRCLA_11084 [Thraustotheca clavata]|uniref:Uncharacterized protein n=1 Tax=Thraustotheca clavata TaxID=74557 RepID=A0A1V9Y8W1_9STRA|nr:hypothetical protein THRCLA_11084 [Thraustotheca clavata]